MSLFRKTEETPSERLAPAAGRSETSELAGQIGRFAEKWVDELIHEVKEHPVRTIAATVAFGFVAGRVLAVSPVASRMGKRVVSLATLFVVNQLSGMATRGGDAASSPSQSADSLIH